MFKLTRQGTHKYADVIDDVILHFIDNDPDSTTTSSLRYGTGVVVGAGFLFGTNSSKLNKNLTIPRPLGFSVVVGLAVSVFVTNGVDLTAVVFVGANVVTTDVVVVVAVVVGGGGGVFVVTVEAALVSGCGLGVSKNSSISVSNGKIQMKLLATFLHEHAV